MYSRYSINVARHSSLPAMNLEGCNKTLEYYDVLFSCSIMVATTKYAVVGCI